MTRTGLVATALLVGNVATGHADVTRCSSADATVAYQDVWFDEMSGDTGWFPANAAAQLKLTGRIAGHTKVVLGLAPTACWTGPMSVTMPARAGELDFAYGAELHLFAQIHTSILGNQIDWSGELPLPADFLLGKKTAFESTLLPGSPTDRVSGTDTTSPLTLLSTNLIGNFIDVPGISGGLHLDAVGRLTTTYRTNRIVVATSPIETAAGAVAFAAPTEGFGATLEVPLAASGTLHYAPALTFNVGFNVKILGISVINFQLFSATLPLPQLDQPIDLAGDAAVVPLPKAQALAGAQVDFSAGAIQQLTIHNVGKAPLMLEPTNVPPGVTAQPLTIGPGSDGLFALSASAEAVASSAELVLVTNDPSQPSVTITLGRDIGGTGMPDELGESSGCNASGGAGGGAGGLALMLLALALAVVRRRELAR
jgi:MYXO-CTERM domain-containing protein